MRPFMLTLLIDVRIVRSNCVVRKVGFSVR